MDCLRNMRSLLLILLLSFFLFPPITSGNPVYTGIETEDMSAISVYLQEHNVNEVLNDSNTTLLVYAISNGSYKVCKYLIENGADVDRYVQGRSPLMYASVNPDARIVRLLIKARAQVNAVDSLRNTALIYAAAGGHFKNCRILLHNGASVNHKNSSRNNAHYYAVAGNHTETANLLRDYYSNSLPDLYDGPYVKWKRSGRIKVFYIVHDSARRKTYKNARKFKADSGQFLITGFARDSLNYNLVKSRKIPEDHLTGIERILVIGDVHGGYDSLLAFLVNNRVIDQNQQWIWGDGHLVFLGDVVDRGDKVTEVLWLIYRLEDQAAAAGGAVHLLLGNHEVMIMLDRKEYTDDKYLAMTDKINMNYSALFSKRTLLGSWLRTRNTIMKINDNIFLHGGLSPSLLRSGLTITQINDMVRFFLNHPDREKFRNVSRSLIMGPEGPLWYRGLLEGNFTNKHMDQSELEEVLAAFEAKTEFIGHTNVERITPLYNARVYALDVPFYSCTHNMQAILIDNDVIFILTTMGSKQEIQ